MQINSILLRVIFLLSTIVYMTDCCSSRILLFKDHTLKVAHQHRLHVLEHARRLEEEQQAHLVIQQLHMEGVQIKKNYTERLPPSPSPNESIDSGSTMSPEPNAGDSPTTTVQPPMADPQATDGSSSSSSSSPAGGGSEPPPLLPGHDTDPPLAKFDPHVPIANFDVLDYYYAIMRDVLTFECSGEYKTDFCLHGGRCFRYPVRNHSFFSCECADGYVGERCESKSLNGVYDATAAPLIGKQQAKVAMARIVFSFPTLIALSAFYIVCGALIVFKRPNKNRAAGMLVGS